MTIWPNNAFSTEPGRLRLSGAQAGWTSLGLCEFEQPANAAEFWTVPTDSQAVVLVTAGSCEIESFAGGRWRGARYSAGSLGFTRPGDAARLRWRRAENKRTLHVHVPPAVMQDVAAQLPPDRRRSGFPDALADRDRALSSLLLAARTAAAAGAPDLYAHCTAHLLAMHMLLRRRAAISRQPAPNGRRMAKVDELLHASIAGTVSLGELAEAAGLSRFELLRAAQARWGETPMRRLTRLRMERACDLLAGKRLSITAIALECGYGSSAHFATAFRRHLAVTPSAYRRRLD